MALQPPNGAKAGGGNGTALRVTCQANTYLDLAEIEPLQGNLKELDDQSFEKLKQSILTHGISFPFFVWKQAAKGKTITWCLDGHQRDLVLTRLRHEGYEIPKLPADFIEAKDIDEAKEKILLAASQYGRVTESGLYDFLEGTKSDIDRILGTVSVPEINIANLLKSSEEPEPPEGFKSYGEDLETEHRCPKCGYEWSGKIK